MIAISGNKNELVRCNVRKMTLSMLTCLTLEVCQTHFYGVEMALKWCVGFALALIASPSFPTLSWSGHKSSAGISWVKFCLFNAQYQYKMAWVGRRSNTIRTYTRGWIWIYDNSQMKSFLMTRLADFCDNQSPPPSLNPPPWIINITIDMHG